MAGLKFRYIVVAALAIAVRCQQQRLNSLNDEDRVLTELSYELEEDPFSCLPIECFEYLPELGEVEAVDWCPMYEVIAFCDDDPGSLPVCGEISHCLESCTENELLGISLMVDSQCTGQTYTCDGSPTTSSPTTSSPTFYPTTSSPTVSPTVAPTTAGGWPEMMDYAKLLDGVCNPEFNCPKYKGDMGACQDMDMPSYSYSFDDMDDPRMCFETCYADLFYPDFEDPMEWCLFPEMLKECHSLAMDQSYDQMSNACMFIMWCSSECSMEALEMVTQDCDGTVYGCNMESADVELFVDNTCDEAFNCPKYMWDGGQCLEGHSYMFSASYDFEMDVFYATEVMVSDVPASGPVTTVPPGVVCDTSAPVPAMVGVQMSNSLNSLTITFDESTNMAGKGGWWFDCAEVFVLPGKDADVTDSYWWCQWTDDMTVNALIPMGGDGVEPSTSVQLRQMAIQPPVVSGEHESCARYAPSTTITIAHPEAEVSPAAKISYSATVGNCDNIYIDASDYTGAGVFPMTFMWGIGTVSPANTDTTDLEAAISEANAAKDGYGSTALWLDNDALVPGTTYTFTLYMENVAERTFMDEVVVEVSESAVPLVQFWGGNSYTIYRASSLTVTAMAYSSSCASGTQSPLTYEWAVKSSGSTVDVQSASKSPNRFQFSPYDLEVGTTYDLEVTVTQPIDGGDDVFVTISATVEVVSAGVDARLAGGMAIVAVNDPDEVITLDASGSIDLDLAPGEAADTALTYSWACTNTATSLSCGGDAGAPNADNAAMYELPGGKLDDGFVFAFTVTVSKGDMEDSATQYVKLLADGVVIPDVSVNPLTVAKVNPSAKLILEGVIGLGNADVAAAPNAKVEAEWTLEEGSSALTDSLDEVATTALERQFAASTLNAMDRMFSLALPAGSLVAGGTYTFQLSAYYESSPDSQAFASIELTANAPPTSGGLMVNPANGTEFTTSFTLSMTNWVDEDRPLLYRFRFEQNGRSFMLGSWGEGNAKDDVLLKKGELELIGEVMDSYGAIAEAESVAVSVAPNTNMDTAAVQSTMQSVLDSCELSGDASCALQALSLTISVGLEEADCSTIAAGQCAALNRMHCGEESHVCGDCLPGYEGASGPGLSKCQMPTPTCEDGVKNFGETDVDCGGPCLPCHVGKSCDFDYDCRRNECESNVCVAPPKLCPGEAAGSTCSGHGTCQYLSYGGQALTADTCSVLRTDCVTTCSCEDGFDGDACELSTAEVEQMRSLATFVLDNLDSMLSDDGQGGAIAVDLDEAVVESMAQTLSALVDSNSNIMDASLLEKATASLETLVSATSEFSLPALNNLLATGNGLYVATLVQREKGGSRRDRRLKATGHAATILNACVDLCDGIVATLTAGEDQVHFEESMVSLAVKANSGADTCAHPVTHHQTEAEIEAGLAQASVEYPCGSVTEETTYGVCTFASPNTEVSSIIKTRDLTSKIVAKGAPGGSSRRLEEEQERKLDEAITYVVPFDEEQDITHAETGSTSAACLEAGSTLSGTCSTDGTNVAWTYTCPDYGTVYITCTSAYDQVKCMYQDESTTSYEAANTCQVVEVNGDLQIRDDEVDCTCSAEGTVYASVEAKDASYSTTFVEGIELTGAATSKLASTVSVASLIFTLVAFLLI